MIDILRIESHIAYHSGTNDDRSLRSKDAGSRVER